MSNILVEAKSTVLGRNYGDQWLADGEDEMVQNLIANGQLALISAEGTSDDAPAAAADDAAAGAEAPADADAGAEASSEAAAEAAAPAPEAPAKRGRAGA